MPQKTLFDLASIDRHSVVVDRAELDRYLEQRGTFAMLDHLCYQDVEGGIAVGTKAIREDDWWAEDHVPGQPMFPGALMIEAAAQVASFDFSKHRVPQGEDERFVGFGGVEKTRFRGVVTPPSILYFCLLYTSPSPRDQRGSRMPSSA